MNADNNLSEQPRRPRIGRGFWGVLGATVLVVGLAGAAAQTALSEESGWRAHQVGFGHKGMMSGGKLDKAEVRDRIERMVAHLAIEIDATDEQKTQLTGIFVGAADDLMALREKAGDRGEAAAELIGLLTGPTVDPVAVEKFRADKIALADEASKRVAGALVEAAEVMTPEQREEVGERLDFFAKLGRFHHR